MNAQRRLVQVIALTVAVSMPILGLTGSAASAKTKNAVGSPNWCLHHPKKAAHVAACASTTSGGGGSDPSLTVAPSPLIETGQSEVEAVVEFLDPAAADAQVEISSPQLSGSCMGGITFKDLQGVAAGPTITPVTSANTVVLTLDDEGRADAVVSGTICAPGIDTFEGSLVKSPFTSEFFTLTVSPPGVTPAGVTAAPSSEIATGDTPASGDSDVYAVFYVEGDPVWAEQEAEISDTQLESSCLDGWIWEPGNQNLPGGKTSGNISGNPSNTGTAPPNLPNTSTDEPFTTIDNDGNSVFVFMGISCAPSSTLVPPGSEADAEVAFNLVGNHPSYMGSFVVDPEM